MNRRLNLLLITGGLLSHILLHHTSQSEVLPPQPPSHCEFFGTRLTGALATRCCVGQTPMPNPPADCPQIPGMQAISDINDIAAGQLDIGLTFLSNAEKMVGNSTVFKDNPSQE